MDLKICDQPLPCGHRCQDLDYWARDKCRRCTVKVQIRKSCAGKHFTTVECWERDTYTYIDSLCEENCGDELPCGHTCAVQCSEHEYCVCDNKNCGDSVFAKWKVS